jgi:hypothetical protein
MNGAALSLSQSEDLKSLRNGVIPSAAKDPAQRRACPERPREKRGGVERDLARATSSLAPEPRCLATTSLPFLSVRFS